MANQSINIRPGVGILGLFPNMNYRAWYALGELVDNALDSYLLNRQRLTTAEDDYQLRVVIEVTSQDEGFIRVWDNAAGIDAKAYQRAFVTAEPPPDSAGLSQFGIGMKSASCWFAREWRVRSKALGERIERTVEFDVPEIIRNNIEKLSAVTASAPHHEHFTEVRLWNLYKPPQTQTVSKMRRHLASMYRQFLRSGELLLEFNGEALEHKDPKVLVAPYHRNGTKPKKWEKEVDFTLPTGERVTGLAGIRERGSTREAGLSLYRHRRLIVGSGDETYRPAEVFGGSNSYRYQRIFGELNLDDFEVSHTKDSFIWEDKEAAVLQGLRKALDKPPLPLLDQAEGFRARNAPRNIAAAASKAVETTAARLPEAAETIGDQSVHDPDGRAPPPKYRTKEIAASQTMELVIKGEPWGVSIETTVDPAATEWLTIRDKPKNSRKARQLGILVSLSHPFTQRFGGATAEDIEGLVRIAVGLAVAETTAREAGVAMSGTIRRNLNELLGNVLARQ